MTWEVDVHLIEEWLDEQNDKTVTRILAALREVENRGPHLGRPLVDTIKGSSIKNLKELRPGSTGFSKIRILFAFDPLRRAVMLVGGDKQNKWSRWYESAIREAELRYENYLKELKEEVKD